ncbi:hypothetical protein Tco_0529776 [Tanacetum coccineum]
MESLPRMLLGPWKVCLVHLASSGPYQHENGLSSGPSFFICLVGPGAHCYNTVQGQRPGKPIIGHQVPPVAENEGPIVTVAKHRTVTLLPTSVVRSSGKLSASVEREFVGDASVGDGGSYPVHSSAIGQVIEAQPDMPLSYEYRIDHIGNKFLSRSKSLTATRKIFKSKRRRMIVNDLGSSSNDMKEDPRALEYDFETNRITDEESYSNDLGSVSNETKPDPHASEHDLETTHSVDEDSYSKEVGSTLPSFQK